MKQDKAIHAHCMKKTKIIHTDD